MSFPLPCILVSAWRLQPDRIIGKHCFMLFLKNLNLIDSKATLFLRDKENLQNDDRLYFFLKYHSPASTISCNNPYTPK